jgi:capsular polysaccharide transport system permease protein
MTLLPIMKSSFKQGEIRMLKRRDNEIKPGLAPVAPRLPRSNSQVTVIDNGKSVIEPRAMHDLRHDAFDIQEFPRRRRYGALLSFLFVVALPTAFAGFYYVKIATPQFVSESHFGVRSVDAAKNDATSIFQGMAAASQIGLDSYMVVEFIKSHAMLEFLESKIDLKRIYGAETVDTLSRLPADATAETRVKYWRKHVEPYFDLTTGSISLKVRTFDPQSTQILGELILQRAEALVNETSQNARNDSMKLAHAEVDRAEERLKRSVVAIQSFRDVAGSINPNKEADSGLKGLENIQEEITRTKAQLSVQKSYLSNRSPAVVATERRLTALNTQLESLKAARTTGSDSVQKSTTLSADIGKFDTLALEQKFAEEHYTSALAAMERAKLQAERQVSYLSVFIKPTVPTSSTYPDIYQNTMIAFAACFAVWIIGVILLKSVREK